MTTSDSFNFEPHSDRFDEDDHSWELQVQELLESLRGVNALETQTQPVSGTKGDAATIILALGTAGVFEAVVRIVSAWLKKDETRKLKFARRADAHGEWITVDADSLAEGEPSEILRTLLRMHGRKR